MSNRKQLLLLFLIFVVSVVIWHIPFAGVLLYPFNLFATYIHEFSHALMAILTGGEVNSISINHDGSGLAITTGGIPILIASGGYLGSSIIGGILLILAVDSNKVVSKITLFIIMLLMLACLIFFVRDIFTFIATIFFVSIAALIIFKTSATVAQWFLGFLAIQSCFYSVYDINVLIGVTFKGHQHNDALMMQHLTLIPAPVWAILWLLISFVVFGLVLFFIYKFSDSKEA
jgi:hypothetical protein